MILSRRAPLSAAAGSGVMLAFTAVGSVSAHISIEEEAVEAGSFAVVTFSVPLAATARRPHKCVSRWTRQSQP
jgi:uncharacterized protein YcnI